MSIITWLASRRKPDEVPLSSSSTHPLTQFLPTLSSLQLLRDVSDIPEELKGSTSQVKLGYTLPNDEGGLNQKWTLASGFPLNSGTVTVKIPSDLETRTTYQVVVFGDSGNTSPEFIINGAGSDLGVPLNDVPAVDPQQDLRSTLLSELLPRKATSDAGLLGRD